jgi:copper(I)-binding protein
MKAHQFCLAIGLALAAGHASADDFKVGTLTVESPWSRATPSGASVGGGYLAIQNTGTESDRLIGGEVEAAKTFQIHNMTMDGDVAKMREVTEGVEIKPGQTVKFEPGATHLMFVGLTQPLRAGQKFSGTLRFEHAGIVHIEYQIVPMGANPAGVH